MTRLFIKTTKDSTKLEVCYSSGSVIKRVSLPKEIDLLSAYFEIRYTYNSSDSLFFTVFANGNKICSINEKTLFPVELGRCMTLNAKGVRITDIKSTVERPKIVPMPPDSLTAQSDSTGRVYFKCRLYKSRYSGERITETYWQIFSSMDTVKPILEELGTEAVSLESFILGGFLDRGNYMWRVRSRNSFKELSSWSSWGTLTISDSINRYFRIRSMTLTQLDSVHELDFISPGEWFRVNLTIERFVPWNFLGYVVIAASDSSYPYGNPANKGGMFLSSHNYVANLSFYTDNKSYASVHEKKVERSFSNRFIANNLQGLYVDPSPEGVMIDTITGSFSVKMRLLSNAAPGNWILSAYTMGIPPKKTSSRDERFSTRYQLPVKVGRNSKRGWPLRVAVTLFLITVCSILIYVHRKKRVPSLAMPPEPEIINNDLTKYLSEHLHREDLSRETIITEMKITRNRFYELLSETGKIALPDLLKRLRITKAKELLLNQKLTVSEIGYKTGFSNISYFIKVFRELEQITPLEFREKKGKSI